MKNMFCAALGVIGGGVAQAFGGWDASLSALVIFMGLDYLTGLIVAGVFHKSTKSESGALESRAGWKGLVRKVMTLLVVLVSSYLGSLSGVAFVRDAVVIFFIVNETISILENAALMGVPIPTALTDALEILKKKSGADGESKEVDNG